MSTHLEIGEPHNYCDRMCERCPVAPSCGVFLMTLELERAHLERGENPHDPDVVLQDVAASLEGTLHVLPRTPPPESPFAAPLKAAVMDLWRTLRNLLAAPALGRVAARERDQAAQKILRASMLWPGKIARLTAHLREDGTPGFEPGVAGDVGATFALLEHLDGALLDALDQPALRGTTVLRAFRRAHARLWSMLAPLQASVPPEPREQLAALVRAGKAPSPFCVCPADS